MMGKSEKERAGYDMMGSRSSRNWLFRDGDHPALKDAYRLTLQGRSSDGKQLRGRKWLRGSTREQRGSSSGGADGRNGR